MAQISCAGPYLDFIDAGVVGTCGKLCSMLEQKTGSQALGAVCDILCNIVGIEEFIKIVQKWVFLIFFFLDNCAVRERLCWLFN